MKAIDLCQKKLKKEAEDMTESGLFIFLVILVLLVTVVSAVTSAVAAVAQKSFEDEE